MFEFAVFLLQTENLQNRLFLALNFDSKKNAASEVLLVGT
jgi:hypothetical protein